MVPSALGGDLGCGMSALRLSSGVDFGDRRLLEAALRALEKAIPIGDAVHRGRGVEVPDDLLAPRLSTGTLEHTREALAHRHLGTLGGGNHFLELDRDADGCLWLLVHSGSRGLGAAIFAHHARVAGGEPLAGLDTRTSLGVDYLSDLDWALSFARWNRQALAARAVDVLADVLGIVGSPMLEADIHHNFVAREKWFGHELLVHRKGAIASSAGSLALVPGSMGTASYLVRGLGNPESFGSCSHGAGRVMRRRQAREKIRPKAFTHSMRGVVYAERMADRLVEEAPAAYRDIREVLDDQEDLVVREVRLEPIAVLKG